MFCSRTRSTQAISAQKRRQEVVKTTKSQLIPNPTWLKTLGFDMSRNRATTLSPLLKVTHFTIMCSDSRHNSTPTIRPSQKIQEHDAFRESIFIIR